MVTVDLILKQEERRQLKEEKADLTASAAFFGELATRWIFKSPEINRMASETVDMIKQKLVELAPVRQETSGEILKDYERTLKLQRKIK